MTPKRMLMLGCAVGGVCCVAVPYAQVDAQAFNANPKTVAGNVSYDRATAGVETITVETQSAIIDWTPTAGIFLPAGDTATFVNGPNNADFAVLNRILATTPVRFDGTVLSRLGDLAAGTAVPGGTIVFSSPGGIIIGSTAVFDVGNLVLTSLNVVDDGAGNFGGPAGTYQFILPSNVPGAANAAIITEPGSIITALNQRSYAAFVAPRIVHGGSVRVDGSTAFVAGERVELRVNSGLFDIIVNVGSDNATPIVHTGSTGGPASLAGDDFQRIYMVAVPKNQAITAILQGNVGFDPAVDAAIENGAIVLSAGHNVVNGEVDRYGDFSPPAPNMGASFHIRGGTITSDLIGVAVTDMLASGQGTGGLAFLQDVSLFADRRAHLFAGPSQIVTVAGSVVVSAARLRSADPGAFDLTGGEALIFAQGGGSLGIAGDALVDASAQGQFNIVVNAAGSGTGGTAGIFADNGKVQINGAVQLLSVGSGAKPPAVPTLGGDGNGGTTLVEGRNGGSVQIGGALAMESSGFGSESSGIVPVTGTSGTGGIVRLGTTGGSVTVTGPASMTAEGRGGQVLDGAGNVAGTGRGGDILVAIAGGAINLNGGGAIAASGFGGVGPDGGVGEGGTIDVDVANGQIQFNGEAGLAAQGLGGDSFFVGGTGGDGTGGTITFTARTGGAGGRIGAGALDVDVAGNGGRGGNGNLATIGGTGGDGRGGDIILLAEAGNGMLDAGALVARANGTGGAGGTIDVNDNGGTGGQGLGGDIVVGTAPTPSPAGNGNARFASIDLRASGIGGSGGFGRGTGGNALGGTATLAAGAAPVIVAGNTTLEADGRAGIGGGSPGAGFGATGQAAGGAAILSAGAGGALNAGDVTGTASATGADSAANTPGEWHVRASAGGAVTLANLVLTAAANGVAGIPAFSSLEPTGGTITVAGFATLTTPGEIRVIGAGAGTILGGRYTLGAGGNVAMTHASAAAAGFTIDVADLFVTAGGDFSAGAGVVTRTANQTDIRAAGGATIGGRLLGRQILIASSDIDLQVGGGIGDAGTQLATLLPNTTGLVATLGGATQGPGYTLTNAEAGRIRAGTLRILPPALGNATALLVRDLTLSGGGAASGIGLLEINMAGIARVEGAVLMTGAATTNGISVTARERLEMVTPTGSIRVRDAAGAPAGGLLLASNNIWVASQAILDRLALNVNYAGRDADLIANDGTEEPRGHVEAGAVVLATGATLFVQNSGAPLSPAFAGITVGDGGLVVRTTGTAPALVTAFGRRLDGNGGFVVGAPFFFEVDFQVGGAAGAGGGGYAGAATFNTCIIVTRQCGAGLPPVPPSGPDPITGPTGGSDSVLLAPGAEDDDLIDTSFSTEGLIEEPVTSGGESSLWDVDCDRDDDGQCDGGPE